MFIDTHAHLADSQFDADRDAAIGRAREAGVATLIEIAESPAGWDAAVKLVEQHPFMYASLGIHPHHAHEVSPDAWPALRARLQTLLRHPRVVAVGEFGLDYFRMQNTKAAQQFIFREQLRLAQELDKPVVIHCREAERPAVETASGPAPEGAHADIQKALREFYPETSSCLERLSPVGVVHCFSGTWQDAQTYLMHGFHLGVDAPVTYPSARLLQQNVLRLPLERMVLETDSPYLPPQTQRGKRNEPSYLPVVAAAVGSLKRKTLEDVAAQTTRNARALFRLPV